MKFDKETAVVVIVCIVLITLCHTFLGPAPAETVSKAAETEEKTAPAEKRSVSADEKKEDPKAAQKVESRKFTVPVKAAAPVLKAASIENGKAVFFFDSNGILHEIKAKNIKRTKSEDDIVFKS